jgi:hypothetical protein
MTRHTPTTLVNLARGDTCDIYIGRPGPFGNPSRVGTVCSLCAGLHKHKSETIDCYRRYFHDRIAGDTGFESKVRALQGKRLGCYCVGTGNPCHGEVIVEFLDGGNDGAVLANMVNRLL